MKGEHEPVTGDEFVIRLIWGDYYREGLPLPVQPAAFQPRNSEVEGISVFREACLSSPQDVLRVIAAEKRDRYQLARLRATDLAELGLSIKPEPIETVPGHAVIPELNATAYAANRLASKVLQKRLAELASRSPGSDSGFGMEGGRQVVVSSLDDRDAARVVGSLRIDSSG